MEISWCISRLNFGWWKDTSKDTNDKSLIVLGLTWITAMKIKSNLVGTEPWKPIHIFILDFCAPPPYNNSIGYNCSIKVGEFLKHFLTQSGWWIPILVREDRGSLKESGPREEMEVTFS